MAGALTSFAVDERTGVLIIAMITISLLTGAKRLAERKVVVKRLVSIEDHGNRRAVHRQDRPR